MNENVAEVLKELERDGRLLPVDVVERARDEDSPLHSHFEWNDGLAVYRDGNKPTFVANEFRELVSGMPELGQYLPDMRQYLL